VPCRSGQARGTKSKSCETQTRSIFVNCNAEQSWAGKHFVEFSTQIAQYRVAARRQERNKSVDRKGFLLDGSHFFGEPFP